MTAPEGMAERGRLSAFSRLIQGVTPSFGLAISMGAEIWERLMCLRGLKGGLEEPGRFLRRAKKVEFSLDPNEAVLAQYLLSEGRDRRMLLPTVHDRDELLDWRICRPNRSWCELGLMRRYGYCSRRRGGRRK